MQVRENTSVRQGAELASLASASSQRVCGTGHKADDVLQSAPFEEALLRKTDCRSVGRVTGASGIMPDVGMALVELSSPTPQGEGDLYRASLFQRFLLPGADLSAREPGEELSWPPSLLLGASHGPHTTGSETLGAEGVTQTAQPLRPLSGRAQILRVAVPQSTQRPAPPTF